MTLVKRIDPRKLTLETYQAEDVSIIGESFESVVFNPSTDYIEYFVYSSNGTLLYPLNEEQYNYFVNYTIQDNLLNLNPEKDLLNSGFDKGIYNTYYNILSNKCGSSIRNTYFISEISPDKTEIRLSSNTIASEDIISFTTQFIAERNADAFFPDFYLNFGSNNLLIANNIQLDGSTVLIKLYEPLPNQFGLKSQCWVVDQISTPLAYNIQFESEPQIVDNTIKLQGPNLNLNLKDEISNSGDSQDWSTITDTDLTSSYQQISSYYADPSIKINVDYTDYNNFINFSSAEYRISNFFYKLQQIESWASQSEAGGNQSGVVTAVSSSVAFFQNKINETIDQFDNFEYYLYFSSGSTPYPKSNNSLPYEQVPTTSSAAQTWITSSLTSGSAYDTDNLNWIYWAIPEYIREDSLNSQYIAFCNMVGHFYDENVWVYVKDITKKWDNDNRIDAGISPDLIAQQLRDLGFTIYENQFSSFNIYSSLLGITPSGSTFPYPDMTGSLPTPSGFQYINNSVTGSNEILPQDDVNKRLYKRIYNALPYLYKKKGTIDGIRALATVYGIPNTLLQINEFGGKDKDNTNDWDYWFEQFNYKFATARDGYINTDWVLSPEWLSAEDVPATVEFRFQTPGLTSGIDATDQVLWSLDSNAYIVLEYTGSGYTSGSFSGSTVDPYYEYATLKLVPDWFSNPNESASIYLPFYNGDFWSVAATREGNDFYLYAANSIYSGSNGSQIGFTATSSVNVDSNQWTVGTVSSFPSDNRVDVNNHTAFSGSYQEIRYYSVPLSQSVFDDYVMNPQSIEGNGINSGSVQLAFRAALGGELYTGSTSIHPKVTGSWTPIDSFGSGNTFTITRGSFVTNADYVFADQPAVGIKNRISDKIKAVSLDLPSGNQQLSNIESIQQNSIGNQAYTPNIDLLEVSFSPTNQINDDIINSLGYLNVGEYIGDPRQQISGSFTYPDLDALRDNYFLKYTKNYDWNDFINLIRFFDNSLFKLIKDYVPAKTSLASGVSIKQHLLERNKYPVPSASYSEPEYTGSIGQIAGLLDGQRIYTASTAYESFPLESVTGSQGGTLPTFVPNTNYTVDQIVNVTQSWEGSNPTPFGFQTFTDSTAKEFVDGEFSGSTLVATTQSLNPNNPFLEANTVTLSYVGSGSLNTDPLEGEFYWNIGRVNSSGNPPIFAGWGVGEMYINETDNNGVLIESALSNLGIGDKMTFTVRTQLKDAFGTVGPAFNRTVTQTIQNIGIFSPSVWYIQFTDIEIIHSGLYDLSLGLNVTNTLYLDPFINTPNFAYSEFNALLNNEVIPRQSELFWDLDYNTNAIQAVNYQTIITASQQNGNLPKAFVQDYNWYSKRSTYPRYVGSRNTVSNFNVSGSGFNEQYSVGTYIGFYSRIQAVGSSAPYYANIWISHMITPDGQVITNTQDDQFLQLLNQNFCNNSGGVFTAYTLPFSSSLSPQVMTNLETRVNQYQVYLRAEGNSAFTGEQEKGGGMIYPAGLELSSANENLQKGFTILRNAGVIASGTGN